MGPTAAWIRWRSSGLSRPRAWATSRDALLPPPSDPGAAGGGGQQHGGPPVLGVLGPLEQAGPDELADQRAHGVGGDAEGPRRLGHADPRRLDDGDQHLHLGRRPAPAGPGGPGRRGGRRGGPPSWPRSGRRRGRRARRPRRRPVPASPLSQSQWYLCCRGVGASGFGAPLGAGRAPGSAAPDGGQVRSAPLRRGRQVGPASLRPASRWRMPLRTSTRTGIRPSPSGAPSVSASPSTISW